MRFKIQFAAGTGSLAQSGVWSVWAAKNKPDLFICATAIGQIKASLHCPRADRPTWKRHFGFSSDANGPVVEQAIAQTDSRHKASWTGQEIGGGWTLEWRVFVPARWLRLTPLVTKPNTVLVPPPEEPGCLIFSVFLGPSSGGEISIEAETLSVYELAKGRLCDGRQVQIMYTYAPEGRWHMPSLPKTAPAAAVDTEAFRASSTEIRAFAVPESFDGTLCFWDLRASIRR